MTRRLVLTYLAVTAVALLVLMVPLGVLFAAREREALYVDIERDAQAVASLAEDALEAGRTPDLRALLVDYRDRTEGRVVVVDRNGVAVADSDDPGAESGAGRDFASRPEVAEALAGRRSSGTRHSVTLDADFVYVAVPVASGGTVHGAVRVTFPTAALDARVRDMEVRLVLLAALVLAVVAGVGFVLARGVTRPVQALEAAARRLADGDLGARAALPGGVPELVDLGSTFDRTAARLEQLVGAQDRFVADAAHQLRSPLTALRLRLENLEPQLPSDALPTLEAADAEIARLSRIVDGLLVLARRDAERRPATTVDVAAGCRDRVEAWRDVARDQDVELVAAAPGPLWARLPPDLVEQVLDNLVENALNVAPPGTTVTVAAVGGDDDVAVHVVDQGRGLGAEERRQAFERFWRADTSTPGTGLGLAIVRQLARSAGGDAVLEEGPGGRGVDAVVRLPRGAPPAGDPLPNANPGPTEG